MVEHASKLNEAAFSAMTGLPLSRAPITSGGSCDGVWFKH